MKIFFQYQRDSYDRTPIVTDAYVDMGDGTVLHGQAVCHDDDMPVKDVGRKIALARAITDLSFEERKAIWDKYFERDLR